MESTPKRPTRRGFLAGMLASAGAVAVAVTAVGKARAAGSKADTNPEGPILYHRTEESDRYYKTLYT